MLHPRDGLPGCRQPGPTRLHTEQLRAGAVGAQVKREQAGAFRHGPQHRGASPVSKEDAGAAIVPVHHPGQGISADHQDAVEETRSDKLGAGRQTVDKAGAAGCEVESGRAARPEAVLHQIADAGERHVRGDGRHDHQVQVARGHAGVIQGAAGGLARQV